MKRYSIIISDPVVQQWFNFLYDEAQLSKTIENFAKSHIIQAQEDFKKSIQQLNESQMDLDSKNEKKGFFLKKLKKRVSSF